MSMIRSKTGRKRSGCRSSCCGQTRLPNAAPCTSTAKPMEIDPNLKRDRAIARGVQAPDQDPHRAALRRNRRHVVLGAAASGKSPCVRSTDGRVSPRKPTIRSLSSPHDRIDRTWWCRQPLHCSSRLRDFYGACLYVFSHGLRVKSNYDSCNFLPEGVPV
jgi:hypothetical protein